MVDNSIQFLQFLSDLVQLDRAGQYIVAITASRLATVTNIARRRLIRVEDGILERVQNVRILVVRWDVEFGAFRALGLRVILPEITRFLAPAPTAQTRRRRVIVVTTVHGF